SPPLPQMAYRNQAAASQSRSSKPAPGQTEAQLACATRLLGDQLGAAIKERVKAGGWKHAQLAVVAILPTGEVGSVRATIGDASRTLRAILLVIIPPYPLQASLTVSLVKKAPTPHNVPTLLEYDDSFEDSARIVVEAALPKARVLGDEEFRQLAYSKPVGATRFAKPTAVPPGVPVGSPITPTELESRGLLVDGQIVYSLKSDDRKVPTQPIGGDVSESSSRKAPRKHKKKSRVSKREKRSSDERSSVEKTDLGKGGIRYRIKTSKRVTIVEKRKQGSVIFSHLKI
ncbi:hypothetical protein PFISCL1PPCAC_23193, partial [Pristionchus fissidentatus]